MTYSLNKKGFIKKIAIGFILESIKPGEASLIASGDSERLEKQISLIEYMEENRGFDNLLKSLNLPIPSINEKELFIFEDELLGKKYIKTFIEYSLSPILYKILTKEISIEEGYEILKHN